MMLNVVLNVAGCGAQCGAQFCSQWCSMVVLNSAQWWSVSGHFATKTFIVNKKLSGHL